MSDATFAPNDPDEWPRVPTWGDVVNELIQWKAEAMVVLNDWDRVFTALGSPGRLGESKAAAALAKIEARVEVPVRWCTVHNSWENVGPGHCMAAPWINSDTPCHLVTPYYDSTEAPQ